MLHESISSAAGRQLNRTCAMLMPAAAAPAAPATILVTAASYCLNKFTIVTCYFAYAC